MRRVLGSLFEGVTAANALLLAVVVALWVRSYFVSDNVSHSVVQDDGATWTSQWGGVAAGRGGLYVYHVDAGPVTDQNRHTLELVREHHPAGVGWNWHRSESPPTDPRRWEPAVSFWDWAGFRRGGNIYAAALSEQTMF